MSDQWTELIATFRDLTAGTIGIAIGQPFDTIKVRLQSQSIPPLYSGAIDCTMKTVRSEGARALFKGMLAPLLGNAPINALAFGAYGNSMRVMDKNGWFAQAPATPKYRADGSKYTYTPPNYARLWWGGAWAGLVQCLVTTPVELIKCRLQVQITPGDLTSKPMYNGTWDCARQSIAREGLFRGLFRGWWATVGRDIPSFGVYWCSYEWAKHTFGARDPDIKPSIPLLLTAGSVAGLATWSVPYPFDIVKSQVQVLPLGTPRSELKMWKIAKDGVARDGWKYFTRGLGTTLVRSIPVNAVTLLVYEESLNWLNGK